MSTEGTDPPTGPNHCGHGGLVTGSKGIFPDDPTDYYWPRRQESVGCTHLRCPDCDTFVRSAAGWRPNRKAYESPADVYELLAGTPADGNGLLDSDSSSGGGFRTYSCRCRVDETKGSKPAAESDEFNPLPWRCAGHPVVTLPVPLDGVSIEAGGIGALVEKNYNGWLPDDAGSFEKKVPFFWTLRLFGRLTGHAAQDEIGQAAAGVLRSGKADARGAATHFFWYHPSAAAAEVLADLEAADLKAFIGKKARHGSGKRDLGVQLAKAMLKRSQVAPADEVARLAKLLPLLPTPE